MGGKEQQAGGGERSGAEAGVAGGFARPGGEIEDKVVSAATETGSEAMPHLHFEGGAFRRVSQLTARRRDLN
eukprot:1877384-Rhodomonas_salina.1